MALFIEYYEVKTANGYEYYFMPMNSDVKNKENLDSCSTRIWKVNKETLRITKILDRRTDNPPEINKNDIMAMTFTSKPVPYAEYYLKLQEIKQYRRYSNNNEDTE